MKRLAIVTPMYKAHQVLMAKHLHKLLTDIGIKRNG